MSFLFQFVILGRGQTVHLFAKLTRPLPWALRSVRDLSISPIVHTHTLTDSHTHKVPKEMVRRDPLVVQVVMHTLADLGQTRLRQMQIIKHTLRFSMTRFLNLRRRSNQFILLERAMLEYTFLCL